MKTTKEERDEMRKLLSQPHDLAHGVTTATALEYLDDLDTALECVRICEEMLRNIEAHDDTPVWIKNWCNFVIGPEWIRKLIQPESCALGAEGEVI